MNTLSSTTNVKEESVVSKEPLWWGRGSTNCLALVRNHNGPYHKLFISTGRKGGSELNTDGPALNLMDFELKELGQFFIDIANGKDFKNG